MKKRGKGISCGLTPSGPTGGGDISQIYIRLKLDGTFDLMVGAVDIGQGCKTTLLQIAAEELDVPIEAITFNNSNTDINPFDSGTFADRVTFMDGNAVINAAKDLNGKIKNFVAKQLHIGPAQLEIADGKVFVKNDPGRAMNMAEVGAAATFGGEFLVGSGVYMPCEVQTPDSETGKMTYISTVSFSACIAEVEVDTETGVVEVVKLIHGCENGKVINPLLWKGQAHGATAMGISFGLTENVYPYYPSMDFVVDNLGDYILTTAADYPPENICDFVEVLHPDGPFGAKGISDGPLTEVTPAIVSAIHDAIGVWITDIPITPERILRALEARGQNQRGEC
jgi:CO/xanthine dehydrogenase Mo-binding subunit